MSARPVTPAKPLGLSQRCVTGVPLVQVFREAPVRRWFWVGRVGHDAPIYRPIRPQIRLLWGGANLCHCMSSMDALTVTYRTPIRAALGRTKEQVCTASAPMAPRRCRDGGVAYRKDMLSCPCRKAVEYQNPQGALLLLLALRQCAV